MPTIAARLPSLLERAAGGGAVSRTIDLDGPVHYVDFGGSGRPIVLVHGLGGSHLNWLSVAPRLTAHGRVYAIDLAGHGLTPSLRRTAQVGANRKLVGRFIDEVAREPAVLVGNSMGGFISLAAASTMPDKVAGLVLVDPAVPRVPGYGFDRAVVMFFAGVLLPGVGGAMMWRRSRRDPAGNVRATLALCCVDPSRIAPEVLAAHVALAEERATYGKVVGDDFLDAVRSLTLELIRHGRFSKMVAAIRAPALIVQGEHDRLVRTEAVRALAGLRRDWILEVIPGVGHVPQLEAPETFLAIVEPWLRGLPR
jgi:pimeloyl-ACP methyl ester carboxylesterase